MGGCPALTTTLPQTALITGASSGIGAELARLFARDGINLVLTGRNETRLRDLTTELSLQTDASVDFLVEDLALPGACERIEHFIAYRGLALTHLVNNAGLGSFGPFADSDPARERAIIDVNIAAMADLTRRFLPGMIRRGSGRILNVGSIAGHLPGPLMANYYATKAWVLWFSLALAEELRGTGVTVTVLSPGATRTRFFERAGMDPDTVFQDFMTLDAAKVALAGYHAMQKGRREVIPGLLYKAIAMALHLAPRGLATRVMAAMMARRDHMDTASPGDE